MPISTMNVTPIKRPLKVLLLQPWSTAKIQTKKRMMAIVPIVLSNMRSLPNRLLSQFDKPRRKELGHREACSVRVNDPLLRAK